MSRSGRPEKERESQQQAEVVLQYQSQAKYLLPNSFIVERYFKSYRIYYFYHGGSGEMLLLGLSHLEHTLTKEVAAAGCPPDLTCQGIH